MKDLKPCPFCGATPAMYFGRTNEVKWAYVACDCGIRTRNHHGKTDRDSIELAARTWNTRFVTCKCGEEIVRCRDCKHYDPNDEPSEVYPDRYWCDRLTVYMPQDGFCSFGKRKVVGE